MPTIRWIFTTTRDRLSEAGCDSPSLEADLLLARATGFSRAELLARRSNDIDPAALARLEPLLARRTAREPLAYILGEAEFYGRIFAVSPDVLIPRADTETLIDAVLPDLRDAHAERDPRAPLRLLDLGTGSGCIILTLLAELAALGIEALGFAADLSPGALKVCARNAESLGVRGRLTLCQGSWFEALPQEGQASFDLIASNPPYVAEAEAPELMPEVRDWEPSLALYAPGDGTQHYAHLLAHAKAWLKPGGQIALELGYGQAASVREMAQAEGYQAIRIADDTAGIPRTLVASWPHAAPANEDDTA